ncbi:MAG: DUF2304 domain-containing protein [Anaerolineaceae bacterium]|nr:DUF2304 domain-containing protein [Anaerolineaceae bacterium]
MNLGQLLILATVLLFGFYVLGMRTVLTDRFIMLILMVAAVFFVLFPDISTVIANWIGIGRGTDMIFYFFILFTLFRFVGISSDRKRIDRSITEIVRTIAIDNAHKGGLDK